MAISQITSPMILFPVYNPNWYVVSSNNIGQENFTYVFDVYLSTGTTLGQRLVRARVPADPINNYGVYNPQKIIQSQILNQFKPRLTGCSEQDTVEYSIRIGESYTFYWNFTGSFTGTSTASTFTSVVGLSASTQHYYSVGDRILVSGASYSPYNGVWEVIGVPTNSQVVLNLQSTTGASVTGITRIFNSVPTIFPNLLTYSGYAGNNAAIETVDYIDYSVINYPVNNYFPSTTGLNRFYTDAYEPYKIRKENRCVLPFMNAFTPYSGSSNPQPTSIYVNTTNSSNVVEEFRISINCLHWMDEIGVGCWNLNNTAISAITVINGSLPIIKDDTTEYYVTLENVLNGSVTITYATIGLPTTITLNSVGVYNGASYYTWTQAPNTYFLWYSSANTRWEVTSALGGGTDYLQSSNSGTTSCPPNGVYNVEWFDGSNPLFTTFTTSCVTTDLLIPFNFEIYEYCGKYDNFEFMFMDRKGAWFPFNFELTQRKTVNKNQGNFKRGLGEYNGTRYTYNSYDRGITNYKNDLSYVYSITSNWLNEEQSLYYEQFFTSPEIYWNRDGNGTFVPIVILNNTEEIKTKKNTRLIQYTFTFELGNNPMVQTGS